MSTISRQYIQIQGITTKLTIMKYQDDNDTDSLMKLIMCLALIIAAVIITVGLWGLITLILKYN